MERAYLSFTETNRYWNINRLCPSLKQDQCHPLMGLSLLYQKFPKLWCLLKQNVSKVGSEWLQRAKSQAPYASLLTLPQPSTSHGGFGKSNFFIVLGSWKPGIRKPTNRVSGEASVPGLQTLPSRWVPAWPFSVHTWEGRWELPGVYLLQGQSCFGIWAPQLMASFTLIISLKVLCPNTIPLGVKELQHMNFQGTQSGVSHISSARWHCYQVYSDVVVSRCVWAAQGLPPPTGPALPGLAASSLPLSYSREPKIWPTYEHFTILSLSPSSPHTPVKGFSISFPLTFSSPLSDSTIL